MIYARERERERGLTWTSMKEAMAKMRKKAIATDESFAIFFGIEGVSLRTTKC